MFWVKVIWGTPTATGDAGVNATLTISKKYDNDDFAHATRFNDDVSIAVCAGKEVPCLGDVDGWVRVLQERKIKGF